MAKAIGRIRLKISSGSILLEGAHGKKKLYLTKERAREE